MIEEKSLTPKQELFALGITRGLNLTDAYRRAFAVRPTTKAETVWSSASRLLADPKVSARVSELRERVAQHTILEAAEVLNEIRRIALADAIGIANEDGTLKRLDQLPPDLRACVSFYEVRPNGTVLYKFWDKLGALEKACRYLGLYERDNDQKIDTLGDLVKSLSGNVIGVVPQVGASNSRMGDS